MILIYPAIHKKPIILAAVEDLLTGNRFLVPMLLDTGADETCFPARFAAFFGHDNSHRAVKKKTCRGIGGDSVTYIHSVRMSLLDPAKSTKDKHVIAWTTNSNSAGFIEKLDLGFGLIGMDIMKQWSCVSFDHRAGKLSIRIEL